MTDLFGDPTGGPTGDPYGPANQTPASLDPIFSFALGDTAGRQFDGLRLNDFLGPAVAPQADQLFRDFGPQRDPAAELNRFWATINADSEREVRASNERLARMLTALADQPVSRTQVRLPPPPSVVQQPQQPAARAQGEDRHPAQSQATDEVLSPRGWTGQYVEGYKLAGDVPAPDELGDYYLAKSEWRDRAGHHKEAMYRSKVSNAPYGSPLRGLYEMIAGLYQALR